MARVIKEFTFMPSYPNCCTASFPGPPRVAQGLKLSPITREYTHFRKNRVQIRKSRTTTQMMSYKTGQQSVHVVQSSSSI